MSLISFTPLQDGVTGVNAAATNTPLSTIYNDYNGNITDANIAAAAAISGSKLASATITASKLSSTAVNSTVVDWSTTGGIWWQELARTTLSSSGDTISLGSFTAAKYLRIIYSCIATGGTITGVIQFNGDNGANYARRSSVGGAADTTATATTSINVDPGASGAFPFFGELDVINILAQEKLVSGHCIGQSTAGAANAPTRSEIAHKWANTSAQITGFALINTGTGDYAAGSEVIVLGHN